MVKIKENLPNGMTMLNLFSGAVSVILALSGHLFQASWFVVLAAFFDFGDGFAARLLHARSEIGAQLDSLADVISFGLAPALIMFVLLSESPDLTPVYAGEFALLPFLSVFLAVSSALRLAKFNTDPGQQDRFLGLPTPAMGLFVASLPFAQDQYIGHYAAEAFITSQFTLLTITFILSFLMISRIPMIALKFKSYKWKENSYRFILVGLSVVLVIWLRFTGLGLSIILYILLSLLEHAGTKKIVS